MKVLNFLILFISIITSCKDKSSINKSNATTIIESEKVVPVIEEHYADSVNIGISGQFKIDVKKFRSIDSVYVEIKFFEKKNSKWILNQDFHFLKDGVLSCDIEIKDFNNDKLNDFTFQSSVPARGANVIRKLFIFDKDAGKLIFIKNSEDFTNLRYNKELDCIDAFRVYGGYESAFAKIKNDSLKEFANVDVFDGRIVVNVIENGKTKIVKNESFDDTGDYVRFKNFSPLKEYETY